MNGFAWAGAALALAAAALAAGRLAQVIGTARDRRRFPAPGTLVDAGGFRLHCWSQGDGEPTVVLDSALAGSALSWSLVQPEVARFTRVISYDRAGLGWSDPSPHPHTALQTARELATALDALNLTGPLVLVGHSYGGLVARAFTGEFPGRVAGLVLIDAVSLPEWLPLDPERRQRLDAGVRLARRGALAASSGLARLVAALATSPLWKMARAAVTAVSGGRLQHRQEGMLSPAARLPRHLRPALKAMWTQPKFFHAMAGQMQSLPESVAAVAGLAFGDRPLVVLAAENPSPTWQQEQAAVARLSSRGRYRFLPGCGHWIPLERPQTVIDAIQEVVEEVRKGEFSSRTGPA